MPDENNVLPPDLTEEALEDLLDATEGDLRKIYIEMQKPDWIIAVKQLKKEGASDPAKAALHKKALKAELAVLDAIQEIDAAKIADIAEKLKAQATDIRAARRGLRDSLDDLENVEKTISSIAQVLTALNKVIGTVGKLMV